MEIFLGIVVVIAVIIFGALISLGNERQRKSIDRLREQVLAWAVQDLLVKRENIKREINIEDPIAWLNQIIAKVYGLILDLRILEITQDPTCLICETNNGMQVVVSLSPAKDLLARKKGRLSKLDTGHVLTALSKRTQEVELSILNAGVFFDLELEDAWQKITKSPVTSKTCFVYLMDR